MKTRRILLACFVVCVVLAILSLRLIVKEGQALGQPVQMQEPPGTKELVRSRALVAYLVNEPKSKPDVTIMLLAADAAPLQVTSPDFRKLAKNLPGILAVANRELRSIRIIHQVGARPIHTSVMSKMDQWVVRPFLWVDQLAADPNDPAKPVWIPGIPDKLLARADLDKIVEACTDAIEADPTEPRFQFELGRALALQGQVEEAAEYLANAAEKDYAAAIGWLGKIEEDPEAAKDFFRAAMDGGYMPAGVWLARMDCKALPPEATVEFEGDFKFVNWITALYQKDFETLDHANRSEMLTYLMNMEVVMRENPAYVQPGLADRLADMQDVAEYGPGTPEQQSFAALIKTFAAAKAAQANPAFARWDSSRQERVEEGGQKDAFLLLTQYDEATVRKVFEGMKAFIEPRVAAREVILPLSKVSIQPLDMTALEGMSGVAPDHRDLVMQQIAQIAHSEQRVIKCVYELENSPRNVSPQTFYYWYRTVPANLDAMLAADQQHPLRALGKQAVDEPPCCTKEAAEKKKEVAGS